MHLINEVSLEITSTVSLMKVEHVLSNGIDPEHHVQVKSF